MRISTSQIFQSGSRGLLDGQASLYKIQNQLSTGKRFLSAQDDPVAAAQVVLVKQSLAVNTQYADNQSNATSQLSLEEDKLKSIAESIEFVIEQVQNGSNSTYSDSERGFIAQSLQSQFNLLLGWANSSDASGYYLFSGYQGNTQPFQQQADGTVNYVGDDGQRLLQIGPSQQISVSDSGRNIFVNNRTGNGTFTLSPWISNTGTGVIGTGTVLDPAAWTGDNYQIAFTSATNYTITDMTTGTLVGNYAYSSGSSITGIPGASFSISGTPDAGDAFTVAPSTNQSVFDTLQSLISAFSTTTSGNAAALAALKNKINEGTANLNAVLENVLGVQASVGSRMNEVSSLASASEALDTHYQEQLSNLQDVDYVEAISAFTQQKMQLEAAQSSFAKISGLSLFNYL